MEQGEGESVGQGRAMCGRVDGDHRAWSQFEWHLPIASYVIFGQGT